jgi:hypothetical protein
VRCSNDFNVHGCSHQKYADKTSATGSATAAPIPKALLTLKQESC